MTNKTVLIEARKYGLITALIVLLQIALSIFFVVTFPENRLLLGVTTLVGTLILVYTYRIMLLGILEIAKETNNAGFIKNTDNLILAVVISSFLIVGIGIIEFFGSTEILPLVSLVIQIISYVYLGIVSIRISKNFKDLESSLGIVARRSALFNKISGWLLVSVLLGFVGIIFSLIADYYMWRVISTRLKQLEAGAI